MDMKTATVPQSLHCTTRKLIPEIPGFQNPVRVLTGESDIVSRVVVIESGNLRSTSNISCRTRNWCYAIHVMLFGLHVTLLALLVHHPEESIVFLHVSDKMTVGLSALLQAIYTVC